MNYILSYNYCNLDRVEYSGADITSISDDVLIEVISTLLQSIFIYFTFV